jgi:hypothetical protein
VVSGRERGCCQVEPRDLTACGCEHLAVQLPPRAMYQAASARWHPEWDATTISAEPWGHLRVWTARTTRIVMNARAVMKKLGGYGK